MRDYQKIELSPEEWLIAAADNAGGIGEKPHDLIKVPISITASYTLRTALMECMSSGARPFSVILHNLTDELSWDPIVSACTSLLKEAGLEEVTITGSTESNMQLLQSAIGIAVLGRVQKRSIREDRTPADASYAVIGDPLVGAEVLGRPERMVSLSLFLQLLELKGIYEIVPAGSRGIAHELHTMNRNAGIADCTVDITKSAGPASCLLISYDKAAETELRKISESLFHPVTFTE
ncbi:hypothetical protein GKZ89_06455 [Bacillus mangrovi]|uniref:ATP-binding protein n=1 Tax=Metabacillus mangrovi TaxID=1491830 RepID=A0A7X2S4F5_9BACI|nr:hypothetical protein [Metabacillus mangrovi]MTH53048.1 hypothetical protein [Metabacillus mangrovi]